MKNRKLWLVFKACFIVLVSISSFYLHKKDIVRVMLRFIILAILVFTFIRDVIAYQKQHD